MKEIHDILDAHVSPAVEMYYNTGGIYSPETRLRKHFTCRQLVIEYHEDCVVVRQAFRNVLATIALADPDLIPRLLVFATAEL